ncbi:amidohydrolase [Leekyejoonella antrihumi]|uniref:Amidohydrolase n=1 Tax=Leekyejoonella antrihumi TaxID=1660198 RepID=A0A563E8G1_9MICO|nr:amidohydrolase [Leekyejoonella antrihumi]TWP38491.1 amidohydrolase [Leekyejoonella antrihumi]
MRFDLVLKNANILTGDPARPRAHAMAVHNGRIVALAQASGEELSGVVERDAGGSTVVPGFHDAHCHTAWYGLSLVELRLDEPEVTSVEVVYDRVAQRARSTPKGQWIIGSGHHPRRMGGATPTLAMLDEVAPEHPVWLIASSGHASVVNSSALSMLDLSQLPERAQPGRDSTGRFTGLLEEEAHALVLTQARPYTTDQITAAVGRAHQQYLSEGITSVQEAGIGSGLVGRSAAEAQAYQQAREQGLLRVRTTLMPAGEVLHRLDLPDSGTPSSSLDLGMRTGFGDEWLRIGPVKLFTDGSVLGRTAALKAGYPEGVHESARIQQDQQWLRTRMIEAHCAGWQLAVHAQGDSAIDFVLDCFEEALAIQPRRDHRHRIEHCSIATVEALERIAELGVVPSPQGRFVGLVGDGMLDLLSAEQLPNVYRAKSFLDRGITLPGSSDRPCSDGRPMRGIHDMVNRRTDSGASFNPQEAVSVEEAIRAYTWGSAYATFQEGSLGTLERGKLADFVVLDDDPTVIAPERLEDVEVLATAVGGVFGFDPTDRFGGPRESDNRC